MLLVALLFCGCAAEKKGTVWRFAIEENRGSVQDAYAQRFKALIEEKSSGKVRVKVYPYGTLGNSDQISELLYEGSVQFAMASPGHLGKMIPEVQVLLLHFVFSEDDEINQKVLNRNPVIRSIFDELYARKGYKLLSVYGEGWQVWTTNKAVRKPEDFEGVKFRVMTSPLLMAAYEAYGASATPLPYAEVYSALQLRMIDGQVNPVFAIQEMSFYEVCDYLIFPGHARFYTTSITNRAFYKSLTAEEKGWVDESIAELDDYILEKKREFNEARLDLIKENKPKIKIIRLNDEEQELFREASMVARDKYLELSGERGKLLLDEILAAIEKEEEAASEASSEKGTNS